MSPQHPVILGAMSTLMRAEPTTPLQHRSPVSPPSAPPKLRGWAEGFIEKSKRNNVVIIIIQ